MLLNKEVRSKEMLKLYVVNIIIYIKGDEVEINYIIILF